MTISLGQHHRDILLPNTNEDLLFTVGNTQIGDDGTILFKPLGGKYKDVGVSGVDRYDYDRMTPLRELGEMGDFTRELFTFFQLNRGKREVINEALSVIPSRLALSTVPLIVDNNTIHLLSPDGKNISREWIKANLNNISIPLPINTNPSGFFMHGTLPSSNIIKNLFDSAIIEVSQRVSRIVKGGNNDLPGVEGIKTRKIVIDGERLNYVYGYSVHLDPMTGCMEGLKYMFSNKPINISSLNESGEAYLRNRVFPYFSLEDLFEYYRQIYSGEFFIPRHKRRIYVKKLFVSDVEVKDLVTFAKELRKLKARLIKGGVNEKVAEDVVKKTQEMYKLDHSKQEFYIEEKDLKLTPPTILALRELYDTLKPNNNELTLDKTASIRLSDRRKHLGLRFDKVMRDVLGIGGEVLLDDGKTPDYIDHDNKTIYDFALTSSELKSKLRKYDGQLKGYKVKVVVLIKDGTEHESLIDYQTFLQEQGKTILPEAKTELEAIKLEYEFIEEQLSKIFKQISGVEASRVHNQVLGIF
ncbi:MAG: hypothetical protein PHE25_06030 [Candidatus Gracilibacteria bacterium]|nr:hypothetical protein [Candidatus Gracilibacteria bacterium]